MPVLKRKYVCDEYQHAGCGGLVEPAIGNPASTPQPPPPPTGSGPVVLESALDVPTLSVRVRADLEARAVEGEKKYGTKLRAHNGRVALVDAYQELLDAVMYLTQDAIEGTQDYGITEQVGALASRVGQILAARGLR